MKIQLTNQQKSARIQPVRLKAWIRWLWKKAAAAEINPPGPSVWSEFSLVLIDDKAMTSMNLEWFGKNRSTDVISFRYDPLPADNGASGEVFVNAELALREGHRRNDPSRELALYVAHGIHHLHGGLDDTPTRRKKMRSRETSWLREAGRIGLYKGLVRTRKPR